MRKYEFAEETKVFLGKTLHRIRAVHDFGNVRKGELGGFIEKEENLSHDGDCWVGGNAVVVENARVTGDAYVTGNAVVVENAQVTGNVWVGVNAWVTGSAWVGEYACVEGYAIVRDGAVIGGDAVIRVHAVIGEDTCISKTEDYLVVGPIGSRNGYTTFYKNKDNGISVSCGCFSGTIEEFLEAVKKTHGNNKYANEYIEIANFANKKIKEEGMLS